METANILVDLRPPLAVVTLNRPQVLNALNTATLMELDGVLNHLRANAGVRVVLLTGAGGKAFAAGADIRELAPLNAAEAQAAAERGQSVFRKIEDLGKPVIACINGFALGGGCELALACTFRIAARSARIGQPEVKLGLVPGYGGSQRLPRLTGRGAALKMLLTGSPVTAEEALRTGLVDELVEDQDLMARAEAIALEIAANAPLAIAETLKLVDEGLELRLDSAMALEAESFGRLFGTQDKAEGTSAFLEKRKPLWKGC